MSVLEKAVYAVLAICLLGHFWGSLGVKDAAVCEARGRVKMENGDWAGALEEFTEAIRAKPDVGIYYRYRGWVRRKLGDSQGAEMDCTQYLRLTPNADRASFEKDPGVFEIHRG